MPHADRSPTVICLGGAAIDHKLKAYAALTIGTSNPARSMTAFGGVARNVAENLAYWMNGVELQCVVGDDEEGHQLLQYMRKRHVAVSNSFVLKGQRTGQYYALLNQDGDMHIALTDMQCYDHFNEQQYQAAWEAWQANSWLFADTNLPRATLAALIEKARLLKLPLCIDPVSVCKVNRLPEDLTGVFLLKPNQDEAKALTGIEINCMRNCIEAGQQLLSRGVENVVVSLGTLGYVIINAEEQTYYQTIQLDDVKDVNGAGDAFMAGILYGLSQGENVSRACEWGAAAAAFTVQSHKTVASNISASQLKAFINNHRMIKGYQHAQLF